MSVSEPCCPSFVTWVCSLTFSFLSEFAIVSSFDVRSNFSTFPLTSFFEDALALEPVPSVDALADSWLWADSGVDELPVPIVEELPVAPLSLEVDAPAAVSLEEPAPEVEPLPDIEPEPVAEVSLELEPVP
jgi:hypothetical protein